MFDMSLLEEAKLLLRRYRIFPKRRLGQNFLVNPAVFQLMADYALLTKNDVVLDVGAGLGFLTKFLAEKCRGVLAVELDARLVKILRERFKLCSNAEIIQGDIFSAQIPPFNKVVSVPPYGISSRLLLWLFEKKFECAILVFQEEFAQRLIAPIGSEQYGWLTVITYYNAEVELLNDVPNWMFHPQPKVDSIIVRLKPKIVPPFLVRDEKLFQKLTRFLFIRRNRRVRKVLQSFVKSAGISSTEKISGMLSSFVFQDIRVRELAPEDFGVLANALAM
ncbi:MAG: 16S rRNA (adenine(1518)-N(6)/adenine(1519)-N(6))-dimethyltransferase RsmA [Candidatus Bathyarchaeales archaeon]